MKRKSGDRTATDRMVVDRTISDAEFVPSGLHTGHRGLPTVLLGDKGVTVLAHRALAVWATHAAPLVVVDGGGCFDVYRIALEARRRGWTPAEVLARIHVCRAFTGYQEVRALLNLRRRFAPGARVVVLNPLPPLLDPDLPEADRPWLFRRLLDGLAHLAREGYTVWVCQRSLTRSSSIGPSTGVQSSADPLLAGQSSTLSSADETVVFERTLARRFPLLVAARGRIVGAGDGQERHALLARGGSGGSDLRGLSPLSASRGSGAFRQAV